jgi:DNA-binding LacI/PurR family transcriptional regulator
MPTLTEKKPRYQEITNQFRQRLHNGELNPGDQLPSFAEMKQQYGASQATMDRVFALLEQEGLVTREQGRGTFVADPAARVKSGLIGFIGNDYITRRHFVYHSHVVEGIDEVTAREEKRILLLRRDSPVGWDQVEGVIVHDRGFQVEKMPVRLPCVAIEETVAGIPSVVADDYDGARQAARHLLQLGHRRIGYLLQFRDEPWLKRRAAGFRDELEESGIEPERDWVWDPQIKFPPQGGYRQWGYEHMQRWLNKDWKKHKFTAVIAQNDMAAIGVIEALREAGLRVPRDVSVMGYDGTEVCDHFSPRISAVEVPLYDIGKTAAEILLQHISGEKSGRESVMLPVRLKPGDTTAPPP